MKAITLLLFLSHCIAWAQVAEDSQLYLTLKKNDSLLFDVGFNTCNLEAFQHLLAEDLEFYHDISGLGLGKKHFVETFKKGLCGNPDYRSRRELLPGTLKVYPLKNNGELYGALQMGEHRFFEKPKGKPEIKGSTALFTHVWVLKEDGWQIVRVLSYDHQMK